VICSRHPELCAAFKIQEYVLRARQGAVAANESTLPRLGERLLERNACARRGWVPLCTWRLSGLPQNYFSVPPNATDSFCNLSLVFSDSALEMSIALPSGAVAAISLRPEK